MPSDKNEEVPVTYPPIQDALDHAETLCASAGKGEALFRQIHKRFKAAYTLFVNWKTDEPTQWNHTKNALDESLHTLNDELQRYVNASFAGRVVEHDKVMIKLKELYGAGTTYSANSQGGIDRVFALMKIPEDPPIDWKTPFEEAEKQLEKALKDKIENGTILNLYKEDKLLAFEAAKLVRNVVDMYQRQYKKLGVSVELLREMLNSLEGIDINAPELVPVWFIPEGEITYKSSFNEGGFGTVHRGTWGAGTEVVVKRVLPRERSEHLDDAERMKFFKEADLWFKLSHPYVLKMFGACHVTAPPFFVCEDAPNGNLARFLANEANKSRIWRLLHQSALAIEYLHGKGIVHGNLKLDNILVGIDGMARVADFGLSRAEETRPNTQNASRRKLLTRNDSVIEGTGALRWCAPEALGAKAQIKSDVYSFAMCLIEAFSGETPYMFFEDEEDVKEKIRNNELPNKPESMPDSVWDLVLQMTKPNPTERISITETIPEIKRLANEELAKENEEKSKGLDLRRCQTCGYMLDGGACPNCKRKPNEVGPIQSKEDIPAVIELLTRAEGKSDLKATNALSDYLHAYQEDWRDVLEAGAVPVLNKVLIERGDERSRVGALKALGCLWVASRKIQNAPEFERAKAKIKEAFTFEEVLKVITRELEHGQQNMKTNIVKVLGTWTYREEIVGDPDVVATIREHTDQIDDRQLHNVATKALGLLGLYHSPEMLGKEITMCPTNENGQSQSGARLVAPKIFDGLPVPDIPVDVDQQVVDNTAVGIVPTTIQSVGQHSTVCLVGPSGVGKTTFIKSIISNQHQVLKSNDRTFDIDHYSLFLEDNTHNVVFRDFAGHDAYQVAFSAFFTRRTKFFVFIDLGAFSIAYLQSFVFAETELQELMLLDEFVERAICHWVHMILACQPDAEFVFIAMKEDVISYNSFTENLIKTELQKRLQEILVGVQKTQNEGRSTEREDESYVKYEDPSSPFILHLLFVSSTSNDPVKAARKNIENLIRRSNWGLSMPAIYTDVLNAIITIRREAKAYNIHTRLKRVFVPVGMLPDLLKLEPHLCRKMLKTLHDLGEILWYENLDVGILREIVILDPMVLIKFIRQVIYHKHNDLVIPHADLRSLPYWMHLENVQLVEAMKKVLQHFHVVYSANKDHVMHWNSDLIVPAYWQTKKPASWRFLGDDLRISKPYSAERESVRVHWEFHFELGLPTSLFDAVVIASVSPYHDFDAGPDWIQYKIEGVAACRLMVSRDRTTLYRTIQVEAVIAEAANQYQTSTLWATFRKLCGALWSAIREHTVSSYAVDDNNRRISLSRLFDETPLMNSVSWMPPSEIWDWFQQLVMSDAINTPA